MRFEDRFCNDELTRDFFHNFGENLASRSVFRKLQLLLKNGIRSNNVTESFMQFNVTKKMNEIVCKINTRYIYKSDIFRIGNLKERKKEIIIMNKDIKKCLGFAKFFYFQKFEKS